MTKETDRILAQLLDECAEHLITGESVAACLARYPEHADALEPMLRPISAIRQLDGNVARDMTAAAKSRTAFMAAVATLPAKPPQSTRRSGLVAWWASLRAVLQGMRPLPVGLGAALAVFMLVGLLTTGVVTASADALPGDALYRVKLASEQARLFLAHDDAARQALMNEIQQHRIWEAGEIQKRWRPVDHMPLLGELESFGPRKWRVSGLDVLINNQTTIVGVPVVGGTVRGTIRAPGDGTLVGVYLEVLPPTRLTQFQQGTPQPVALLPPATWTPTPWVVTATPLPTQTPLAVVPESSTPPEPFPTRTPGERHDPVTPRPVLLPTQPFTPVPPPTATELPLPTPTQVELPPRSEPSDSWLRTGMYELASGSRLVVNGATFEIDGGTVFEGDPQPGDTIDLKYKVRSDGSLLALLVRVVNKAATPVPMEFTGRVQTIMGETWTVSSDGNSQVVRLVSGTQIFGNPQISDPVKVTGGRYLDGVHAKTIEKLLPSAAQFTAVIREIAADSWLVESNALYRVYVITDTEVTGQPAIGRIVDVDALQDPIDGKLTARALYVPADTPTPTGTASPTATSTPTATDTPTPAGTSGPTDTPTATETNTPAAAGPVAVTDTPQPPGHLLPGPTTAAPAGEGQS